MTNPLLQDSTQKNYAPHFEKVKLEHYLPAIETGIAEAKANFDKIKNNEELPTFQNTLVAMESASETLDLALSMFYNLIGMTATPEMEALAKNKIGPLCSEYSSDIAFDPVLFARIKALYDDRENHDYTSEELTMVEDAYKGFVRSGALLPEEKQQRLREISLRMTVLGNEFEENQKAAKEAFHLALEEDDLTGLPQSVVKAAAQEARDKGLDDGKYVITLDVPSYGPFLTYSDRRDLREKVWRAARSQCWQDEHDNSDIVIEIANLRHESAQILGYDTYAAYVLEERMAETPENVDKFLADMKGSYKAGAKKDLEQLKDKANDLDGITDLQPWDVGYYAEIIQQELYNVSSEDFRPYLSLQSTLDGVFEHYSKLFNVRFDEVDHYEKWHEDVKTYDVYHQNTGDFVGTFYADFHPRKGKSTGAWQSSIRSQGLYKGNVERPVVAIVCNLTKPTEDEEAQLTHDELTTILHEMGHALHGMLSDVTYQSVAGTSVKWDFVELPSQLQENWGFQYDFLSGFAKRKLYKEEKNDDGDTVLIEDGEEIIPEDLVQRLNDAKNFMVAWGGLRQTMMATLDMAWHSADPSNITDVAAFEESTIADMSFFPRMAGPISNTFSHVFAGGYSAGYYSYKWAEVLDADAFEAFLDAGLYDRETADRYVNEILKKGGSVPPAELYRNFRGRDADPAAVLRREGIEQNNDRHAPNLSDQDNRQSGLGGLGGTGMGGSTPGGPSGPSL